MSNEGLSFLFNKKSPIFLVEIVSLITSIIIRAYPNTSPEVHRLTTIIIVGCILEIVMKTVALELWSCWCQRGREF